MDDKAKKAAEQERKKRWFAAEYMLDYSATGAARRCQFANPGNTGPRLVENDPLVKSLIARGVEDRQKEIAVEIDELVMELRRIAFSDINDYASWNTQDGKMKIMKSNQIQPGARRAIKKIKQNAAGELEIELHDKMAAIDKLAKLMGFYVDIKDITVRFKTDASQLTDAELDQIIEHETKRIPVGRGDREAEPVEGSNGVSGVH